ncbi:MAG: hypothetical protein ACUVX9_14405 [Anaerolineae bacterium]
MIVGYDPPNLALLVHFGASRRHLPLCVDVWEASLAPGRTARVEAGFDPDTNALVALLFCRRSFFMPSFDSRADLLARWRLVHGAQELRIDLSPVPRPHDPLWIRPGVQLLLSLPQRTGRERPFLHSLRVYTVAQALELDLSVTDIRVVPRSLDEATVSLFCEVEG